MARFLIQKSVPIVFILPTMPPMAKQVKVACLVNKHKSVYWIQVMNTMTSDKDRYIVLMDMTMTDVQ